MMAHNKSFFRGILCASFTWAVSLYLYWMLTSGSNIDSNKTLPIEGSDLYVPTNLESERRSEFVRNEMINHNSIDVLRKPDHNLSPDDKKSQFLSKSHSNMNKWSKDSFRSIYYNNNVEIISKKIEKKPVVTSFKYAKSLENDLSFGYIKTPEDRRVRDEGYKVYAFNVLASQRIGDSRLIPDTRNELCKSQVFPANLPDVSIIICFYNEHYYTLTRSVQSILDRTPRELLKEIILVDDYSDIANLHSDLEKYVSNLTNLLNKESLITDNKLGDVSDADKMERSENNVRIKLLKTARREGLIRARLYGAENSTGTVMVFLDSHIEVNKDWLQPLLKRLSENVTDANSYSTRIAIPIIDVINADTFQYKASPLVRGGFNWGLHFKWDNLPKGTLNTKEDFVKPIKSPTMAGGLFAIYRKYFNHMGKYDSGMNTWGGENLELSFRIWMCGGSLEIIPCSRVGHVFRKRRPYGSPEGGDSMLHNSMRLARVWLDSYIDNYIKKNPSVAYESYGDVSDRIALRKSLNCSSFEWYLNNVYPELVLDTDSESKVKEKLHSLQDSQKDVYQPWHSRKRNYVDNFQLRLTNTTLCIQAAKDIKTKGGTLVLATCSKSINQVWYKTALKELVLGRMLCLEAITEGDGHPTISKCHEMAGSQEWEHKAKSGEFIYNSASGTCLGVDNKIRGAPVVMKICSSYNLISWDLIRS